MKGEATIEEVEKAFATEKGKPPVDEKGTRRDRGHRRRRKPARHLDLKPGRYVFLCFISDRQGGPPHALKGMVNEVEIE